MENWNDAKEYVRKVSGGRGGSYQENKAVRLSEEFSWPGEIFEINAEMIKI